MSATKYTPEQALARAAFVDSLKAAGLDFNEEAPSERLNYTLTNWVRGERVLIYEQFGSYQGEWLTLSIDDRAGEYRIYKGYYGSCSGCDEWEADGPTGKRGDERVLDWAFEYPPFVEIPRETAANVAMNGAERFAEIMPANMRGSFSEIDNESFARDSVAEIKLEEKLPIVIADVFGTPNAELRRRLMEAYGVEAVVRDAGFVTLDSDGPDLLIRAPHGLLIGEGKTVPTFLFLKDSSTPRRYLLRVPPNMERVRQAKAWTFDLGEHEYRPEVET